MSSSTGIYEGFWFDYASATYIWTLQSGKAAILQAILPIFVTIVGFRAWEIAKVALYFAYYGPPSRFVRSPFLKALSPQQAYIAIRRVLIRNSNGGLSTALAMSKLALSFRNRIPSQYPSLAPIILGGIAHSTAWIVSSILVALLWTSPYVTDVVLLRGDNCGFLKDIVYHSDGAKLQQKTYAAATYVKQCYSRSAPPTAHCSFFPSRRLPVTLTKSVSCPFESKTFCNVDGSAPIRLDTGLIDSFEHLGINAPKNERISFQKTSTCSPIYYRGNLERVKAWGTNETLLWPKNAHLFRFHFGNTDTNTFTFETSDASMWYSPSAYYIRSLGYFDGAPGNYWMPNATFFNVNQTNADLTMYFMSSRNVLYAHKSNDPFFKTKPIIRWVAKAMFPSKDFGVLACVDQYRICDSTKLIQGCTAPGSLANTLKAASSSHLNAAQIAVLQRLKDLSNSLRTSNAVMFMDSQALLVSETTRLVKSTQYKYHVQERQLRDTQWHDEVLHWFSTNLASLQQQIIDFVDVPRLSYQSVQSPTSAFLRRQCRTQRVRQPSGVVNFNCTGLGLVLIVGSLLIGVSYTSLHALKYALKMKPRQLSKVTQWGSDGPSGLLREINLAAGFNDLTSWTKGSSALWDLEKTSKTSKPVPLVRVTSSPPGDNLQELQLGGKRSSASVATSSTIAVVHLDDMLSPLRPRSAPPISRASPLH